MFSLRHEFTFRLDLTFSARTYSWLYNRLENRCHLNCAYNALTRVFFRWDDNPGRGSRVRELWRHVDASLETRWHRSLPLQRLRTLLQDERSKSPTHQAQTTPGKYLSCFIFTYESWEKKCSIGKLKINRRRVWSRVSLWHITSGNIRNRIVLLDTIKKIFKW